LSGVKCGAFHGTSDLYCAEEFARRQKAGSAGQRGVIMLLLNLMLVTVFVILLAVSVGEIYDAVHVTQRAPRGDPK
jgi:hypothetical protein